MKGCVKRWRGKGEPKTIPVMMLLLVIMTTITAVTTTTIGITRGAPRQNSNSGSATRESPPTAATYWAVTYGGGNWDEAHSVQQTSDGGYIVAGYTISFGAGYQNLWVLKLNSNGLAEWQKTYGVSGVDEAWSIQQTSDGGYIVAGRAGSDVWVLKLNSGGSIGWQKTYEGSAADYAMSAQETSDGGYIVAGYTYSSSAGGDFWVLKLSYGGSVEWQNTYGGSNGDYAMSAQQTSDGGYIVAGYTYSFGAGYADAWVLKLSSDGSVEWQKTYGGVLADYAYSVQQTSDGGYIVAGSTNEFVVDLRDSWVLKLNSNGSVEWQKTYGGGYEDYAYSVQQTSDGGYIVAGSTNSLGATGWNFGVFKLNSNGSVDWNMVHGGNGTDEAYSVQQTSDGGYIVAGFTNSFGAGGGDLWVLKLNSTGSVLWNEGSGASTQATSVTPGGWSSVIVSATSVSPVGSAGTVQDTQITPEDTHATMMMQSGTVAGDDGGTEQGLQVIDVARVVFVAVLVILVAVMVVKEKRRRKKIT